MGKKQTRFNPLYVAQVERLASKGFTDDEMSDILGIVRSTFYDWKLKHKEFSDAVERGKAEPIAKMEAALFNLAVGGQEVEETITEAEIGSDGKPGRKRIRKVKRTTQPDLGALKMSLINRAPAKWRDKQEHAVTIEAIPEIVVKWE